jgi:hypothetical protein
MISSQLCVTLVQNLRLLSSKYHVRNIASSLLLNVLKIAFLGVTFAVKAFVFQWMSWTLFFLSGRLLLSASDYGVWTRTDRSGSQATSTMLEDSSLSNADKSWVSAVPSVHDEKLKTPQAFQLSSASSASKRFVPLSAPAKGSVAHSV